MAEPPDPFDPTPGDSGVAGGPVAPENLYYGVAGPDPGDPPRKPGDGLVRAEVLDEDEEDSGPPLGRRPLQFTLGDLLILTTALAVFTSMVATFTLRWSILAGMAGLGAFAATVVLVQFEPEQRAVRVACWSMVGFYVLACVVAVCTNR